jgi:hypothetical protein
MGCHQYCQYFSLQSRSFGKETYAKEKKPVFAGLSLTMS